MHHLFFKECFMEVSKICQISKALTNFTFACAQQNFVSIKLLKVEQVLQGRGTTWEECTEPVLPCRGS